MFSLKSVLNSVNCNVCLANIVQRCFSYSAKSFQDSVNGAAGRESVIQFENPSWHVVVVEQSYESCHALKALFGWWHPLTYNRPFSAPPWGQKRKVKTTVWMVFMGPIPRGAECWQSGDVDCFQAWHWCQKRVHECIVVTPGDES